MRRDNFPDGAGEREKPFQAELRIESENSVEAKRRIQAPRAGGLFSGWGDNVSSAFGRPPARQRAVGRRPPRTARKRFGPAGERPALGRGGLGECLLFHEITIFYSVCGFIAGEASA
jgi:hypothetical protein